MNWDAIGAIAELLGAIAVVATLAYLARQQHQTNRVAKASLQMNIFDRAAANHDITLQERSAAEFLTRLKATAYEELDTVDLVQLEAYIYRNINDGAAVQASHDQGLLPDETLDLYISDVRSELARYPATRIAFEKFYHSYPNVQSWPILAPIREGIRNEPSR